MKYTLIAYKSDWGYNNSNLNTSTGLTLEKLTEKLRHYFYLNLKKGEESDWEFIILGDSIKLYDNSESTVDDYNDFTDRGWEAILDKQGQIYNLVEKTKEATKKIYLEEKEAAEVAERKKKEAHNKNQAKQKEVNDIALLKKLAEKYPEVLKEIS